LHVPLKGFYTTIDYIAEKQLPLIFVTSGKLGSINHTLLSLEACRNRGISVEMVLYNTFFDTDEVISADTYIYIENYLKRFHHDTQYIKV
ncbi:MAG: dethiobiotin synthase, partial [Rikenellaceae bacterium]